MLHVSLPPHSLIWSDPSLSNCCYSLALYARLYAWLRLLTCCHLLPVMGHAPHELKRMACIRSINSHEPSIILSKPEDSTDPGSGRRYQHSRGPHHGQYGSSVSRREPMMVAI